MGMKYFGARMKRLEDPNLLTGTGRFVDDIHLPGTWHAAFVRSPHAHACISAIEASAALALPGVHAVLTYQDLPESMRAQRLPLMAPHPRILRPLMPYCLARDEVTYVGECVAIVLADNRYVAEDAVALVDVDYNVLEPVVDCRAAVQPGSPMAHSDQSDNVAAKFTLAYGHVSTAFQNAAHVVKVSLLQQRGSGHAIECRAALANYDEAVDKLTVWIAGQTPHTDRRSLEIQLGLDPSQLRVIMPDVGGGFGTKALFYSETAVVAACALQFKRPIKWIEDRRENFLAATQERCQYWDIEMALDADGKILGVRGSLLHDNGAFLPHGIVVPLISGTTVPGPYVVPSYQLDVTVALTNLVPTTPVRGAGRPQAVFAMERLLEKAARKLKLDPVELRRRNLVQPQQMPYPVGLVFRDGQPLVYDSGDYPACQQAAIELSGHGDFPARQAAARAHGRYIGIGIANYVEGSGLGPFEGATVRVLRSGKVRLLTGAAPQGQGHRSTLAQIVADQLGILPDDVDVVMADTDAIPMGVGTFASRIAANAGPAVDIAAARVRERIVKIAAHLLETSEEDIEVEGGRAHVRGVTEMGRSFAELAAVSHGISGLSLPKSILPGLEETHYFSPAQATYCNGTHVVEVDVDIETASVRILRYVVAHDSGRLINPLIVDGQIQGGVAHGVGDALFELMVYDGIGQPLTATFADYLLPAATDVPEIDCIHIETPTPLNPLGVKGAGEGGTIPAAAAIIAAVENALAPFGIEIAETPIRPERLYELLTRAGAYASP